jgi:exopolysaccharide biosynthesis polyprenyl glycosylphosphotransferase
MQVSRSTAAARFVPVPRLTDERIARPVSPEPASRTRPAWLRRYSYALLGGEMAAGAAVAAVLTVDASTRTTGLGPVGAAASLGLVWPLILLLAGAHAERVFSAGSEEYRRVGRAGLVLLAGAAVVAAASGNALPRAVVLGAVPSLVVITLLLRYVARQRLSALRARGRCTKRVVLVGRGGAVRELKACLARETHFGLEVVAACVTPADRDRMSRSAGVPVGGLDDVVELALRHGADTVAVTSSSETAAEYLRRLSWQLEGTGLDLLVAPGLIEVAGPRLHIRPFEGLPLLAVEAPRFEGWQRAVKAIADRSLATLGLVVLAPTLLLIALAVKLTSEGPVLYRQERVGVHGRTFLMLKFRSMVVGADQQLEAVREADFTDGLLFKAKADPRVTPVGRWLRRLSLDELPQLFNVLGGSMSLVGPRPPLPSEVERYDSSVRRRLLVKPGLTGLWQISGRSDLPWEDAVRLDLRYVENWSLATDLLILWRTGRAVLSRSGAY